MRRRWLIVCEQSEVWAAAVRCQLPPEITLRQTRTLGECIGELKVVPGSVLALELTPRNVGDVLSLVSDLEHQFPRAAALVFAQRGLECYEALMREAGILHFVSSPRGLQGIGRTVLNHWARQVEEPPSVVDEVWDWLPWGDPANRL